MVALVREGEPQEAEVEVRKAGEKIALRRVSCLRDKDFGSSDCWATPSGGRGPGSEEEAQANRLMDAR